MTRTDLFELIRNRENSGVEFKRDTVDNRSLARELVAFANLDGGIVLLGVEDDGTIAGVTRDSVEEWVMTTCRDKIRPELIPYYEVVRDVEPGRDVAVVRVSPGWSVHHLWHNNHRTYYIRVGTQSREASPEELQRLFQQRGDLRAELRPVSGTELASLDMRRLEQYFALIRGQSAPVTSMLDEWQMLLVNTEIMTGNATDAAVTLAGLLLFGTTPNRWLPQAGIDAAAFTGTQKDYDARERIELRGPLTPLFQTGDRGRQSVRESGLVEQAVAFVRRNTEVQGELRNGARRGERWTYPEEAVREALVNALVHRDYLLSGTSVELTIYADRLEVVSPGRLPNGITPDRMKVGCRASRNQLLKDVMRDYAYLEHMGMGVPRKIIKGMQEHNGTDPELIEDGEAFTVRLLR